MSMATRSGHARPLAPRIVLAILSIVAAVALSQCMMTADKVTGVDPSHKVKEKVDSGNCIPDCAHSANDAMDAEKDLHKNNVQACGGDATCLANEEARHEAAVNQIQADRKACMDGCHEQGNGRGH